MAVCLCEQALKRSLDTRTAAKVQPAVSKTVLITWDEEDPSANPTSSPSEDTAEPQVAGDTTAPENSSAAAAEDTVAAADSAAHGAAAAAADELVTAVAAVIKADVAARASDARAAAELAAADAGSAAAAAAANAGAVAADAVRNAQVAADAAAAESTAAAAASMAAAAAINADVTAANADVSGARTAAAAFSKDLAAHLTPGVGNFITPVADVSGARTAGELAAAFSKELAAHLTPRFVERNTQPATAAARKDPSLRRFRQAAALGEREVPVQMVDDIADHPTSKERAITGAWNGGVGGGVASDQAHLVAMVWAVLHASHCAS